MAIESEILDGEPQIEPQATKPLDLEIEGMTYASCVVPAAPWRCLRSAW